MRENNKQGQKRERKKVSLEKWKGKRTKEGKKRIARTRKRK